MHGAHALPGLALCGDGSGIVFALFAAGLIGSLAHCSLMCGPLVLAQVMARLGAIPAGPGGELRRLAGAALLPYHAGRLLTYAGLGALAAAGAGLLRDLPAARYVGAGLLALAALLLALQALPRAGVAGFAVIGFGGGWARRLGPLLAAPTGRRGLLLGLALGLLPCGLVYAALAAAAATGDPGRGALAMAAFGLGTVPMLAVIALLGEGLAGHWRQRLRRVAPLLLLVNAGWLGLLAVRLALGEGGP
ncbi:sulfite exporter TauE/SafE family protein [Phaeospirillum tilakii]|uniref:Sulfite exporter TauE/SafE family protein n=1 Tax=Phaeospirillum tilakii TaxID=741673 RepID=A0ABW5C635_9PROT